MKFLFKALLIIVSATVLTALGIDAADTISGSRNTLLGQLAGQSKGSCPTGMITVAVAPTFTCVDQFEVSPAASCPNLTPNNAETTIENMQTKGCEAVSKAKSMPWRFVSRDQAATLCLKSGKRLPTNEEWHLIALGSPDDKSCNVDSNQVVESGKNESCKSAVGVFDAVGNVWEWTSDEVVSGKLKGRILPETGYVNSADAAGIAIETSSLGNVQYGQDYIWTNLNSVWAIMRGGFYGSGEDAGVYSVHADVPGDMFGDAIGFRCVK